MIPWKEYRGPIGMVLILAMLTVVSLMTMLLYGYAPPQRTHISDTAARSVAYPVVHITPPKASIFAPQYAY